MMSTKFVHPDIFKNWVKTMRLEGELKPTPCGEFLEGIYHTVDFFGEKCTPSLSFRINRAGQVTGMPFDRYLFTVAADKTPHRNGIEVPSDFSILCTKMYKYWAKEKK